MTERRNWCLIGIPDHQGILNVGGRIGAALAPAAFRPAFARLNGLKPVQATLAERVEVTGLASDIETNHRQAADAIRGAHARHSRTVVVGGGHDHGFSQLLGIHGFLKRTKTKPRLGCINLDAHLDVRKPNPLITSGSPFYLAIESGILDPSRLVEFGIQSHCNWPPLWEYVKKRKIPVVMFEKLRGGKAVAAFQRELKKLTATCDAVVVQLDLDCVNAAQAPGVSAPQAEGFTSSEIMEMMEIAGKQKKVISLGIFELSPPHDRDEATARLAATSAYHFIEAGL